MLARLLTAKLAAATLTVVVAVGAAAATTLARATSEREAGKSVAEVAKSEAGKSHGRAAGRGPAADGPAKAGLCRAWVAGNGGDNGGKEDAAAFQALVDAAGGRDKVAGFCATTTTAAPASTADVTGNRGTPEPPKAAGAAPDVLCRAWASGRQDGSGQARDKRMSARAFESLAAAAGGAANIPTYCAEASAGSDQDQNRPDRGEPGDKRPTSPADTANGNDPTRTGQDTSNG